ncbi:MAG TPA: glycoside hydrolase family 15 protein, partial [Labilithrix sp.]
LLLPITRLLPSDDPRVRKTIEAIDRELTIDGWVHRFVPCAIDGIAPLPMGEYEGAFVLCTAWLASAWAIAGEPDRAASILERIDSASGELGLLAEGIDARSGEYLGNTPLLFSHVEYVRAVLELDRSNT